MSCISPLFQQGNNGEGEGGRGKGGGEQQQKEKKDNYGQYEAAAGPNMDRKYLLQSIYHDHVKSKKL